LCFKNSTGIVGIDVREQKLIVLGGHSGIILAPSFLKGLREGHSLRVSENRVLKKIVVYSVLKGRRKMLLEKTAHAGNT